MFESLKIEETTTHSVVVATLEGNPFSIRATVGTRDGHFIGTSFLIVTKGDRVIDARCHCSDYGVEHSYTGDDADALTELCQHMTADLEETFAIHFLSREEPAVEMEEPQPPAEEPEEEGQTEESSGDSQETIDPSEVGSLEDVINPNQEEA